MGLLSPNADAMTRFGLFNGRHKRSPAPVHMLKPVGIMHFRPPIDRRRLCGLREPEHRGERRDAKAREGAAQIQRAVDVHDDALAARHQEAIGADDRGAFEQRMQDDAVGGLRADIEFQ